MGPSCAHHLPRSSLGTPVRPAVSSTLAIVLLLLLTLLVAGCAGQQGDGESVASRTSAGSRSALPGSAVDAEWFEPEQTPEQIKPPLGFARDTLWPRLAKGYRLQSDDNAEIARELAWFRQHPAYVYRITERAHRYLHHVLAEVEQRGMPTEIALLPMIESGYNPFAYSRSGAAGMWQFMPMTAARFELGSNAWYDGRKDVVASTEAALSYLTYLHKLFDNDWLLAVAAYNFGEGNIRKAVDRNRSRGLKTDFWSLELRQETRTYVPKLLAFARVAAQPQRYGLNLYPVPDRTFFTAIEHQGQIDLHEVAERAKVSPEEILRLNPAYAHGFTDPQRSHRLLAPVEGVDHFRRELARHRAAPPIIQHYSVAKGDTLGSIARRFNLSVEALQASNRLTDSRIRIGQPLLIPVGGDVTALAALPPPPGSRQVLHTIQPREVLWRIARRYSVTPQQIARWNGLAPDEGLRAGERLSIWTRQGMATVAAASPSSSPASIGSESGRRVGYTVRSGDSLYAIATRFKVQVNDIVRWNGVDGTHLYPGQKLTLYVGSNVALN